MSNSVPFLDLDQLRQEERSSAKTYSAIYKNLLTKCHEKIRKINKRTESRECFYEIPIFIPGYPVYNIQDAKSFIIHHLNNNGILAESVGENRIYVSWKPEDVNQQQFEIQAQKANGFQVNSPPNPPDPNPNPNPNPKPNPNFNHKSNPNPYQGFKSPRPQSMLTRPLRKSFKPPKYDPRPPSGVMMGPPEYSQPTTLPYNPSSSRSYSSPRSPPSSNLKYPETALQNPKTDPPIPKKSKVHTIFKQKPSISEAFKKPIDMVEPPKYIKARTINILPESPLLHQNVQSNSGNNEEGEKVTMLQYDKKFGDMLPVNTKKLQSMYPGISYKKGRPPF